MLYRRNTVIAPFTFMEYSLAIYLRNVVSYYIKSVRHAALLQNGESRMRLTRSFCCQRAVKSRKEVAKEESDDAGRHSGARSFLVFRHMAAVSFPRRRIRGGRRGCARYTR